MGVDPIKDQPGLEELQRRVEKLEHEVAMLLQQRAAPASTRAIISSPAQPAPPPLILKPQPRQSMENRIGSQWFSRIGIIALLIATALFLKLAIDNHWIGPLGRILVGLIGGAALILWSERFRRQGVAAFSYALKAIGSGVLYLTLWAAFQLYGLMPAPVALGAMLLVTAWNAYMAWSQDAELLAAYALIGGFATPGLLSTGGDHELFLFSYLLAIDAAVVALVRLKSWPRLLLAAFLPTVAYYATWYLNGSNSSHPFALTTAFVVLFFAAFASASTALTPDEKAISVIPDVFLPLANAAFTSIALYALLNQERLQTWAPWIAVLLAAIYLALLRVSRSAVAAAVHLSLAILFLTIAIPLKATGRGIVIGWFVEGAALLWVSSSLSAEKTSTRIRSVLRSLACGALTLGFLSVLSEPLWIFTHAPDAAFLNWRFATGMIGAAAFAVATGVSLRAAQSPDHASPRWLQIAAASIIGLNLTTLWSVVQEIAVFWRNAAGNLDASLQKDLATSAFLALYGAALLAVGFWKRRAFVRWQALILLVFTIGKTFLYDMGSLSIGYRAVSLLGLGALLMAVSFAYQKDWLNLREPDPQARPEVQP
jgi:uncharacterized membrane protein